MAQYVVLETQVEGSDRTANGLAFTAVPAGNNQAGVPWVDVIKAYRVYRNRKFSTATLAAVPVAPATQAELDAGTLFEWRWRATFPISHTNPQAVAAIEAEINTAEPLEIDRISDLLRYWGFTGDS